MKTKGILFLCLCMLLSCLCGCTSTETETKESADTVIIGNIYTGNDNGDYVEALAVKDGVIVYAGDEEGVSAYEAAETVTLEEGQLVTAGFGDGHTHVAAVMTAMGDSTIDLSASENKKLEEYIEIIEAYLQENPDQSVYVGKGWINSAFENGCPTADILDALCPGVPMMISSADGHSYWVNSAMMELAGVTRDTAQPKGGKIEQYDNGEPNGCFRDTAMYMIKNALPFTSVEAYKEGIRKAQNLYASLGYTSYVEIISNEQSSPVNAPLLEAYEEMDQAGELLMYVQGGFVLNNADDALDALDVAIQLKEETAGGNFELTTIKIYMDGVIEGATAYLSESYSHKADYYGAGRWTDDESKELLKQIIVKANEAGLIVHFHAIGDQAIADAVDCVEAAYEEAGDVIKESRNAITHLQVVKEEDFDRLSDLNMVAVLNPWAFKAAGFYEETEVLFLGEERAENEYPMQSFLQHNVTTSFGTDFGGSTIYEPLVSFHTLVTRTDNEDNPETTLKASECLSTYEAIEAMTKNVAYQFHREDNAGTLEVGKSADLIILSKDILTCPANEIETAEVLRTMSQGSWIYGE